MTPFDIGIKQNEQGAGDSGLCEQHSCNAD